MSIFQKKSWLALVLLLRQTFAVSTTKCGQYDSVVSVNGLYQYNTDAWGNDGSGFNCVTVRTVHSSNSSNCAEC